MSEARTSMPSILASAGMSLRVIWAWRAMFAVLIRNFAG